MTNIYFRRKGMYKKWEFYKTDEDKVKSIAEKHHISELLATVLVNIIEDEEIRVFLEPNRNDFHDPYLMPDMKEAVDRLLKAIESNERVMIYGDYDVDGITSTTVLKKFLRGKRIRCSFLYS